MQNQKFKESLEYHENNVPGKLGIFTNKSCKNQLELSLAYSPGVAGPSIEIYQNSEDVYRYTMKGNTIAVVSDGSAVLGLGDIGPLASYPVMEGKSMLLKVFADIDSFPICLGYVRDKYGRTDPKKVIETVKNISPTFGAINLEDIASPYCFEIEKKLDNILDMPVFHDDQHGTAIISLAGILNSLKLVNKKLEDIKVVINGAGAAGIATCDYYIKAGLKKDNIILCDSIGVVFDGREERMNKYKKKYATRHKIKNLKEALVGADVFIGLSKGNLLDFEDIKNMAKDPIIFALANPNPEIMPDLARKAGAKIIATGRSDFPNQVNNVLGFPGIFRGALDTRARVVNYEMKMAATNALAEIANERIDKEIEDILKYSYEDEFKNNIFKGDNPLKFDYIIPKPFDPRVVPRVAKYVAKASMETGVARKDILDLDKYEEELRIRINNTQILNGK
jgi:malate dehydrogenase (oxaloacetate-decarboxylating)(NADP+)